MRQHLLVVSSVLFACLAFALACGYPALAASSTDALVSMNSDEQPDPRLLQKVTYKAKATTVKDICADLSKMTGVTIKAGSSDSDWMSRDRKMNVFVEDVPLVNLMNSMARAMKFTLTRGKDDPPSYRMYMSPRMRAYAQNLRDQQQEQVKRLRDEGRASMISALEKVRDMTPEQVEALKEEDPGLYMYGVTGIGQSLGHLLESVPQLKTSLLRGDNLVFNASDMTPEAQQSLQELVGSIASYHWYRNQGQVLVSDGFAADLRNVTLHTNFVVKDRESEAVTNPGMFLGDVTVFDGNGCFVVPLEDPFNDLIKLRAKTGIRCNDENKEMLEAWLQCAEVYALWEKECRKYEVVDGSEAEVHNDDPVLDSEITVESFRDATLDGVLEALSESGISVVSDEWGREEQFRYSFPEKVQLVEVVRRIALSYQLNWEKRTSIVEFSDKNWFVKLDYLVPESLISRWRRNLEETGTLDIADLMRMAGLARRQSAGISDEVITSSGALRVANNNRWLLKACAALENSQWRRVFSSGGLDLSELNDAQWETMGKAILYKNAAFLRDPETRLTLKCERTQKGRQWEYSFALTTSADIQPVSWTFTTPEYVKKQEESAPSDKPSDSTR